MADEKPTAVAIFEPESRDGSGRFKKGFSGNPGGLKKQSDELKAIFAAASVKAANKLEELLDHPDGYIAEKAANSILDRHLGKPVAAVITTRVDNPSEAELDKLSTAELLEKARQLGVRHAPQAETVADPAKAETH